MCVGADEMECEDDWADARLAAVRFPGFEDYELLDEDVCHERTPSGGSPMSSFTADGDDLPSSGAFASPEMLTPLKRSIAVLDGPALAPTFVPTGGVCTYGLTSK